MIEDQVKRPLNIVDFVKYSSSHNLEGSSSVIEDPVDLWEKYALDPYWKN